MEQEKCRKYREGYNAQKIAFVPLVVNSWGLCGPDFLQFLWAVADYAARTKSYLQPHDLPIPDGVNTLDMEIPEQ